MLEIILDSSSSLNLLKKKKKLEILFILFKYLSNIFASFYLQSYSSDSAHLLLILEQKPLSSLLNY